MSPSGSLLIGGEAIAGSGGVFHGRAAATGEALEPAFSAATPADLERACALAWEAFDGFRDTTPEARARLLEAIGAEIEAIGEALTARGVIETGLPVGRLTGERGRTIGQLNLFAAVLRAGSWIEARFDTPLPDRAPAPRPDLRQRQIAIGPVAVFGASNFPLAFSVAGGDTASALAGGCPVVVKAHPAHPGLSELVGGAIQRAVAACGLHPGVFSLLHDHGLNIAQALVADPRIKAVGFTGSRRGGLALVEIAQKRPEPIPVYAEMSSVNPVILMPAALAERAEAIGTAFVGSLTLGAGQFCTNPGLILAVDGPDLDRFIAAAAGAIRAAPRQVMLTAGIRDAYVEGVSKLAEADEIETLHAAPATDAGKAGAALFQTSGAALLANPSLAHEVFGAAALVVRCADLDQLQIILESLEGQLTAALHVSEADHADARTLMPVLERKVGRILANGFATGVEVSWAMVHGGPFPATSDGRTTSVGAQAITRFLRPICYQDLPEGLLPDAVKTANPWGAPRWIDGRYQPSEAFAESEQLLLGCQPP